MRKQTLRFHADPAKSPLSDASAENSAIAAAAALLRAGGTVAFPTETVYGLGANALDPDAVARIFEAKRRPSWDPLIVHIADELVLEQVVQTIPEPARLWMQAFWPGPLTLLLPRAQGVPFAVTAGRERVGVRMPQHPVAQALLLAAKRPVAAPSANLFGHVSPTTAQHVLHDLDGRIDAVLDGGPCALGLESTVVDACEDPCVVYRPGAVTLEQLAAVWPRVVLHNEATVSATGSATGPPAEPAALASPGLGLRHYAPSATLVLVEATANQQLELQAHLAGAGAETGLLLPQGLLPVEVERDLAVRMRVLRWGRAGDVVSMAQELFAGLRALDEAGVTTIVCPLPPAQGVGTAVCDRLRKAARPH